MVKPEEEYIDRKSEISDTNNKETRDLLKEIEFLKAENAYLKKLRVLVQQRIARENPRRRRPSKN